MNIRSCAGNRRAFLTPQDHPAVLIPEDHPEVPCPGRSSGGPDPGGSFRSPSPGRGVRNQPSPPGLGKPARTNRSPGGTKEAPQGRIPLAPPISRPSGPAWSSAKFPSDKSLGYSRLPLRSTRAAPPEHKDAPCRLQGSSRNAERRAAFEAGRGMSHAATHRGSMRLRRRCFKTEPRLLQGLASRCRRPDKDVALNQPLAFVNAAAQSAGVVTTCRAVPRAAPGIGRCGFRGGGRGPRAGLQRRGGRRRDQLRDRGR